MRTILPPMLMILIAVLLTGSLALPHICLDNHTSPAKVEQHVKAEKTASNDHHNSSKNGDHCCMAHHCCFAKLANSTQSVWKAPLTAKSDLFMSGQNHLASFDPKGLDRPPKFFA